MYLPNDIIIRKTPAGEIVWVSQRVIEQMCQVSEEYLWKVRSLYKNALPKSWRDCFRNGEFFLGKLNKSWRWGKKNGQYYYDLSSIPNKKPCCYQNTLNIQGISQGVKFISTYHVDSEKREERLNSLLTEAVMSFINNTDSDYFLLESEGRIKKNICDKYAEGLGWCRLVTAFVQDKRYTNYGYKTQSSFYDAVSKILHFLKLPNLKVSTGESLRQKLMMFPLDVAGQRSWIVSGKFGNKNRLIVGKYPIVDHSTGEIFNFDLHQAVMYQLYMNIGNVEKERLLPLYNEYYTKSMYDFGIEPIAYRTFCHQLTRLGSRLKMDYWKHGEDYYKKKLLTYIPAEKLSYAHSLFCGDGSGTIGYRYYDEKGRAKIMNLYTMVISDVASGKITGYSFSKEGQHNENVNMVTEAVKMSVKDGNYQTMFEFVSDNHGAFTSDESKEFLHSVFNRVRTISVGNSQGNPAETQFRIFKNTMLRSMRNFIRTSHGASIYNTANIENISKDEYPSYNACIEMFEQRVKAWNNRKDKNGLSPSDKFDNKHPECELMSEQKQRLIFGNTTKLHIERMRGFVTPRGKAAQSYGNIMYEIPNYASDGIDNIQRATGNNYDSEVKVMFDQRGADLYSLDGKYIMTCLPVTKAIQSHAEKTPEHKTAQVNLSNRKKEQISDTHDFARGVISASEAIESFLGYRAEVALNGGKELVNQVYEEEVNEMIGDNKKKDTQIALSDFEIRKRAREQFI